jgi:hypothetical protein
LSQKRQSGEGARKVLGANCAYKRRVFAQVGAFRRDIPSGGDAELAYRMKERTGLQVQTNVNAIVRHRNVSTLSGMLRQYMRYGTAISLREEMRLSVSRPSLVRTLFTTVPFAASFVKRLMLFSAKRIPSSIKPEDKDIYLWRPCLRVLNEWAVLIGFKIASQRPEVLR